MKRWFSQGLRPLPHLKAWRAVGWFSVLLIVVLSIVRLPDTGIDLPEGDKIGHFLAYFCAMSWAVQLCATRHALAVRALGFILLGLGLEAAQTLTSWRFGNDPRDAMANTFGVLAASVVWFTPLGRALAMLEDRWNARRRT